MANRHKTRDKAAANFWSRLAPAGITTWASINASTQYGPFKQGDFVIIICTVPAHVNAAALGGSAGATNPQLPQGIHDLVVPAVGSGDDDDVYIFLNSNGGGGSGVAYKASV